MVKKVAAIRYSPLAIRGASGRLHCPIHNVKQQARRWRRGTAFPRCVLHPGLASRSKKACLERTGGDCLCSPKREAERRTAHHGCRASMGRRGRGPVSGPLAFRRSSAVVRRDCSRLGLGRASWNHRMQTGGPSPAPVQRAPRSPARAGRDDAQAACRPSATDAARRNRTRSVSRRHRLTSLTMNGMAAVIQIRAGAVKGFLIYADKSRGCAERWPLCASPGAIHSVLKIRKIGVVPVNQGFLRCANFCAAARRRANSRRLG
jgi:hypothetical protein